MHPGLAEKNGAGFAQLPDRYSLDIGKLDRRLRTRPCRHIGGQIVADRERNAVERTHDPSLLGRGSQSLGLI